MMRWLLQTSLIICLSTSIARPAGDSQPESLEFLLAESDRAAQKLVNLDYSYIVNDDANKNKSPDTGVVKREGSNQWTSRDYTETVNGTTYPRDVVTISTDHI